MNGSKKLIGRALRDTKPKLTWELFLMNAMLIMVCVRTWKSWFDYAAVVWSIATTIWFIRRYVVRKREWQRAMNDYEALVRDGLIQ